MRTPTLSTALAALLLSIPGPAAGIAWRSDYEATLVEAARTGRVVFLAVNMDGEQANDRLAQQVYKEERIRALAGRTLNLVASTFEHGGDGKPCPRFGVVECKQHQEVEKVAGRGVLETDARGWCIAPQHVFLGPDGEVLLSITYEITANQLEWCFVTALKKVDPDCDVQMSRSARQPRGVVVDGVVLKRKEGDATQGPEDGATRDEILGLISELRKGAEKGSDPFGTMLRIATADEPEARDYLITALRAEPRGKDRRPELLNWIGQTSPTSYWEVCAEFVSASNAAIQAEAIVALEQLAAPESLKVLRTAVSKEKDEKARKNLLRALGAVAGSDARARKALLKEAEDGKKESCRVNAIIALGYLEPDKSIDGVLRKVFEKKSGLERGAAAMAMALTGDPAWIEVINAGGQVEEPRASIAVKAALDVLGGAGLERLRPSFAAVAGDEIVRERLFK